MGESKREWVNARGGHSKRQDLANLGRLKHDHQRLRLNAGCGQGQP